MDPNRLFTVTIDNQSRVSTISDPSEFEELEKLYLRIRSKENRLLEDEVVEKLPLVDKDHPHYKEWKMREDTMNRFFHHLGQKTLSADRFLLDIGCGNGWLSNQLALNFDLTVIGVDINREELEQANRVFDQDNLYFIYYNVLDDLILPKSVDFVLLASSIQYFSNLSNLFSILMKILTLDGEIHILDTPIYDRKEIQGAKQRSESYYRDLGEEEMINYYSHHDFDSLRPYDPEIKFKGRNWLDNIAGKLGIETKKSPFPWLKITKRDPLNRN